MTTRELVEKEVKEAMNSGLYSVAGLNMFEQIDKIKIDDNLLLHLEYTEGLLREHLNELLEFKGKNPGLMEYLRAIKEGDIRDNQHLEKENSFMIGFYSQIQRETAIERLIKYAKNGKEITSRNLFGLHNTLLYGTSSEENEKIRTRNDKFVGRFVDGQRIIDYFPIDYKDIKVAADKVVKLYNDRLNYMGVDNVFFQPFLVHGLVAALQMFNDGNTRLGRILQHALLWQLINERMGYDFELPPVYATRSYYPMRGMYRDKIAHLVEENNSESWNSWFDFNLSRIEDSIYAADENVKILKRKIEFNKKY